MITVEDVKKKLKAEPAKAETVVGTETEKKKKPFYRKPLFWGILLGGGFVAYKLATRGKNANNSIQY